MNRSILLTSLSGLIVASVLMTSSVRAEFSYIAPDLKATTPLMTTSGLRLDTAVGQIIPDGFVVSYLSGVSRLSKIKWASNKPWPIALKEALKPAGLQYTRNGTRISISKAPVPKTLMPKKPVPKKPVSKALVPKAPPISKTQVSKSQTQKTQVSKIVVSKTSVSKISENWAVKKGERLSDILERWGQKTGVRVQFLTDRDWPIASDYQFIGTVENATKSLLGALSTSNPAPAAKLTNNRQLLIIRHQEKVEVEPGASEVIQ